MAEKNTPQPLGGMPDAATVAAQLQYMQLQELLEKKRQKDEEENQQKAVRKASAEALQAQRKLEIDNQNLCPHMKEKNQGTAVVGSRDSQYVEIYICQHCHKEFTANTIPPHLRPNPKHIGGPIPGYVGQ